MKNSKFYQSMLVIIASAMFFTACKKPKEDELAVTSPNLVSGSLVFNADDGVPQSVEVSTNVNAWEVTKSADWIKTGRTSKDFSVSVEKYTDTNQDRTGQVTVTAGNAKPVSVTVTQKKAKKNTLTVDLSSLNFTASQTGFKDVTITTDAESWDATSTATWFSIQKQDKTLKVTVNALNRSAEPRTSDITVTAGNADPVKVTVNQDLTRNTLEVAPKLLYYPEGVTGTKSANVVTDADDWVFTGAPLWLDVNKQGNKLEVTPKGPNTGESERTAEITVIAGNAIPVVVTVIQERVPPIFLRVNPASLLYEAGQTGNKTLTVETNAASWDATSSSDWFTSQKSGNTIIVNVSGLNNGSSQRSANITVTAPDAKTVTVPVSQEPTPYLSVDPTTPINFGATETSTPKTATVSTNVTSWTFSNNSTSWLNVVKNDNTLSINPTSVNTGTSPRTATISISATGVSPVTVTVIQNGDVNYLEVDPKLIVFTATETVTKKATIDTDAASWSHSGTANWLTIVKQNNELSFTPSSPNTGTTARTATITVTAGTAPSVTVTVRQDPPISITVNPTSISYTASETATKTATVTTTADSWSFSNNADTWLNVVKNNNILSVNPTSANTTTAARTATITLSAPGATSATLTVTQARATLSVSPTTPIAFAATSPGTKTVNVTTTAQSWNATSSATWCKINNSGNTISISPDANTGAARSATITVTAPGANNVTVTVNQDGSGCPLGQGSYRASGTPYSTAPSSWTGLYVPSTDCSVYGFSNFANLGSDFLLIINNNSGKYTVNDNIRIGTSGNLDLYFAPCFLSGSYWYGLTNWPATYNASNRTLSFGGTYNGFQVYIGLWSQNRNDKTWTLYTNTLVRSLVFTLTPVSNSSMPDSEIPFLEDMIKLPVNSTSVMRPAGEMKTDKTLILSDFQNQ